ncbi:MAG TPA: S49 family peptidase [Gemmataceae bacterium]
MGRERRKKWNWGRNPLRLLALLALTVSGCLHPVKAILRVDGPIFGDMAHNNNDRPIVAMPVDNAGGGCKGPHVAILDVDGLLLNTNLTGPYASGDNPVDVFREKLDAAMADPCCTALVVRINSPGGSVTATDMMWRELQWFRQKTGRPVIACLMDLACGGAYYLATASDLIVAHPTTVTGGVGVVLNLYNFRDAMGAFSLVDQSIKAGPNIDLGSALKPLPPQAEKLLQEMADELHGRFREVVRNRRGAAAPTDDSALDGRVFLASKALERGLVDRIGYLPDAIAAARELAGQPQAATVLLHRTGDVARTPYATTPNIPFHASLLPFSVPGLERSKLPMFLYLWQPDPTLERLHGR